MSYELLFRPLEIGTLSIPNRIFSSAHATMFADDNGLMTERHAAYYEARARGGIGLIITGAQAVSPYSVPAFPHFDRCVDDRQIPCYRWVTDAVHRHGTKIFAQLWHFGRQGSASGSMLPLQAASPGPCPLLGEIPKEMDREDIERTVKEFADGAVRCREGGFDGIEIHGAHGYLFSSFLSPASNFRTDEYGGTLENRMRFALEVIAAVRKAVGEDFVLGFKLSADEFVPDGLTLEETREIARILQDRGRVDFLDVSVGAYGSLPLIIAPMYVPLGFAVPYAAAIKEVVDVPVFAIHRIKDPAQAEEILRNGQADMVAMTRATICDPELPRKAREGREDEIRNCVACNQGCWGRAMQGVPIGCALNAWAGHESDPEWALAPTQQRKTVFVVGGGPGGAEAARVAALRGHAVRLYDRATELGGQLSIASKASGREELQDVGRYYARELRRLGVDVRLGTEVDVDAVVSQRPDAVVLATGARPLPQPPPPLPKIRGADGKNVFLAEQVLGDGASVGDRVVVYSTDSHLRGATTADTLADRGKQVTLLVPTLAPAPHAIAEHNTWMLLMTRLAEKGVEIVGFTAVTEIEAHGVKTRHLLSQKESEIACDAVVLAVGAATDDALYHALRGKIAELHRVGDCVAPRRMENAIYDGARVGRIV
jgi:mycofactocin system FadH/OYE family oxidoreductase 2